MVTKPKGSETPKNLVQDFRVRFQDFREGSPYIAMYFQKNL